MAIMKDVAELAGVSISTVSFVLNGTAKEHKVADKTADKVLRAARQLGYKVNLPGNSGIKQWLPTLAFFMPLEAAWMDMNVVCSSINRHKKQTKSDYSVLLCPYEKGQLMEKINQIDPACYEAAVISIDSDADAKALEQTEKDAPFVLHNAQSTKFSSVSFQVGSAVLQVAKMIAAKGYHKINIFAGSDNRKGWDDCLEQFIDACSISGVNFPEEAIIATDNTTMGGAIAARTILSMEERPEMIICMNTSLAFGAIPLLARNDFFIPKNAELLCFGSSGDGDHVVNYIPSLSMIALPIDLITISSFDIALRLANDRATEVMHIDYPCDLLLHSSFAL